jgi:hypothetical protein
MAMGRRGRGAMIPHLQLQHLQALLLGGFQPGDGCFKRGNVAGKFQDHVNRGLNGRVNHGSDPSSAAPLSSLETQ